MAKAISTEDRSRIMAAVKSRDTKPEMAVRRALHAAGFRFRLHSKDLPGKPDIVLPRYRIAIMVNGCFWHGHDCPSGSRSPKTNQGYWLPKIERTRKRDKAAIERLAELGWTTVTVWECDLARGVERLIDLLNAARANHSAGV